MISCRSYPWARRICSLSEGFGVFATPFRTAGCTMRERYQRGMYRRDGLRASLRTPPPHILPKPPRLGKRRQERRPSLGVSAQDAKTLGLLSKPLEVSENAAYVEDTSTFADWCAKLKTLRNAAASIRSVASGIRCWGLFCDATQRPIPSDRRGGPGLVDVLCARQDVCRFRGPPRKGAHTYRFGF